VLAAHPDFYNSCPGLAYTYALKEDFGETERWLEEMVKRTPVAQAKMEGFYLEDFYAYLLGRLGRSLSSLLALRNQAEKYKFDMGVAAVDWVMGFIYADTGEFEKARKAFGGWLAYVERRNPADRTSNAVLRSFSGGWVDLKQGGLEEAKAHVAEIENFLLRPERAGWERVACLAQLFAAEVALARNSVDEAIRIGEKIDFGILTSVNTPNVVGYNLPQLKDVLARAYWKKGELDKAVAEYERLTTIDPKNRLRMLIHPLYHYRFGRVLEQKGDKSRARLEYEKFLKYWADADPRFVELKDARSRLAALNRVP
jgi:tetratricopeptide (TPR) repeat protein